MTVRRTLYAFALLAPFVTSAIAPAFAAEPESRKTEEIAGLRHPEGWKIELAATEPMVINPVTMTFGPDGRLYVAEWKAGRGPNDHIKVLTDTDGDGRFDRADLFMENLELPAGILFWDGWVYLTLDHDVVRLKDRDGDGAFEVREVIASGFGNDDSHHRVSGLILGPDGWLYLTTGDSDAHAKGSDGSTANVLRCGGVFRCRPDGTRMENVAFGMRNPWGNVAFDDAFHIFHTDNDNEGTPGFTGCRLLHVVEEGDYGWRLREGARCCAPDFDRATWNGGRPGRLGWMAETGRGAPAGLCVLNSAAFPDRFRNLLVYPDVFRKSVRGYSLKPTGATYQAVDEFELLGSDEGLFRPTDAEIGPDGALYVLDWRTDSGGAGQLSGNGRTGRIYRLSWSGTAADPARPTLDRDRITKIGAADVKSLVKFLSDPDYSLRRAASLELIRRGKDVSRYETFREVFENEATPGVARLHALGVLYAVDPDHTDFESVFQQARKNKDRDLLRFAFELIGRRTVQVDADSIIAAQAILIELLEGALLRNEANIDPQLLRASLMGQARLGQDANRLAINAKITITQATMDLRVGRTHLTADPFLRDGITRALERLGPGALPTIIDAVADHDPKLAQAALFALQGWRSTDALSAILATATSPEARVSEDARVGLFRALREMVPDVPADPIARWLADKPSGGARSRVKAIQVLTALHNRAVLAAGPILPGLLNDPEADVRKAALALARDVRTELAKEALIALVRSDKSPADERGLALSALRGYDKVDLAPLAREVLAKTDDPALRMELMRALASRDFPAAAKMAEGMLDSKDREQRQEAIGLLGSNAETASAVARRFLLGKLPPEDLSRVMEAVRPYQSPELKAELQTLLTKTLLAPSEIKKLGQQVARSGNPDLGRAVFLDVKKGGCATCHRMEGVGGNVGPDLTRVWETLSFDKRVESILEPSKEIKEGFGTYKVATTNGRVLTGLLLAETGDGVTLRDPDGREVRIPAREIDEKGFDKTSLMPAGILGQLTNKELTDLLAFLGDRKAQEALRAEKPGK